MFVIPLEIELSQLILLKFKNASKEFSLVLRVDENSAYSDW